MSGGHSSRPLKEVELSVLLRAAPFVPLVAAPVTTWLSTIVPSRLLRRVGDELEDPVGGGGYLAAGAHHTRSHVVTGHGCIEPFAGQARGPGGRCS
jgi:hypothetical protein